MRLVELRFARPVPDLLRELRVEGLNVGEIAHRVGVPYATVHRWLVLFGLDDATLIRTALEYAVTSSEGAATRVAP